MKLSEMLASIPAQAKAIKESLGFDSIERVGHNPITHEGLDRNDRVITSRSDIRRVAECAKLMADVYSGRRPMWHLREAMTVSDFPNLFGDLLYRQLLGNYNPYPVTYPRWARIA